MSIYKDIEKLCEEINKSDLSDEIKSEAITLLRYNIVKEHQIREYNKGCRHDSLN